MFKRNGLRRDAPQVLFQTLAPWRPDIDIGTDEVIVHLAGIGKQPLKKIIDSWKRKGYRRVGFMFHAYGGSAAFYKKYPQARARTQSGRPLRQVVPTKEWIAFVKGWIADAIRHGAAAVYPEEAENYAVAGYERVFKREWRRYYREPWRDPATSVDSRYQASELKGHLWRVFYAEIFSWIKKRHPRVQCIVPMHSALNYANWHLVFAHSPLMDLEDCDGVIGQVWSDTAKLFIKYRGRYQRLVFENAYLEYSFFVNLLKNSGKLLWLFNDFLSDESDHGWLTYRRWYQDTLVASLLLPGAARYEITPWPEKFSREEPHWLRADRPLGGLLGGQIPHAYVTELLALWNAQAQIARLDPKKIAGNAAAQNLGVFISDTIMWQNHEPSPANMDSFYGLALPLLRAGRPAQVLALERLLTPGYLDGFKVLLLSYDAIKPLNENYHAALADWVRRGGCLVHFGGSDAYNRIARWWQAKGCATPQEDLFAKLGVRVKAGEYREPAWRNVLADGKTGGAARSGARRYAVDLSPFLPARALFVKIRQRSLEQGGGCHFSMIRLKADRQPALEFRTTDSRAENRYLVLDTGAGGADNLGRLVEGVGYAIYRLPTAGMKKAWLEIDIQGNFAVEVAPAAENERLAARRKNHRLAQSLGRTIALGAYPLTVYPPERAAGRETIYHTEKSKQTVVWEKKCGAGHLICVGVAAAFFVTRPGAEMMRRIVRYAFENKLGLAYNEDGYLWLQRDKYLIARAMTAPLAIKGDYLDLMDALLMPVRARVLQPGDNALLVDLAALRPAPKPRVAAAAAAALKTEEESERVTRFISCGPATRIASIRVYAPRVYPVSVKAEAARGREQWAIEAQWDHVSRTLLLLHAHKEGGIRISIEWTNRPAGAGKLPWRGELESELRNK